MGTVRDERSQGVPSSWTWPDPPRSNRYGATVTEIRDVLSDGRRVAVVEGALWPPVGGEVSVFEDDAHTRRGAVSRVELVLGSQGPARIVVWVELVRESG